MTPLHVAADNSSSLPTKYVFLQNHSEIFFLLTIDVTKWQIFLKFQIHIKITYRYLKTWQINSNFYSLPKHFAWNQAQKFMFKFSMFIDKVRE